MLTQGERGRAEDLVQKVFEAATDKWEDQLGPGSEEYRRKWLFRVLKKKAIDEWRAPRPTVVEPEQIDRELGARPSSLDTCDIVLEDLERERLWKVLKIMPPARYRIAYLSWNLAGHSSRSRTSSESRRAPCAFSCTRRASSCEASSRVY